MRNATPFATSYAWTGGSYQPDVLCLLPAEDTNLLAQQGELQAADDVVLSSTLSAWNSQIILNHCSFSS